MGIIYLNNNQYNIIGGYKGGYSTPYLYYHNNKFSLVGSSPIIPGEELIELDNFRTDCWMLDEQNNRYKRFHYSSILGAPIVSDLNYVTIPEEDRGFFILKKSGEEEYDENDSSICLNNYKASVIGIYNAKEAFNENSFVSGFIYKNNIPQKLAYNKYSSNLFFEAAGPNILTEDILEESLKVGPSLNLIENASYFAQYSRFLYAPYLPNATNLAYAFQNSPVKEIIDIGPKVTNMYNSFFGCNFLKEAKSGKNVIDMEHCFFGAMNLEKAACGKNVTNMQHTYHNCVNLKEAVCGPNVKNMVYSYMYCTNLKKAACGPNVEDMAYAFESCVNLEEAVCGPNVTNVYMAYAYCPNLKIAACGDKLENLSYMYYGSPNLEVAACGNSILKLEGYSSSSGYYRMQKLRIAACGTNVINLEGAYGYCPNLEECASGDNVKSMTATYSSCNHLLSAKFGPNVSYVGNSYIACDNLVKPPYYSGNLNFNKNNSQSAQYGIESYAFSNCNNLVVGYIPKSCLHMYGTFANCYNLKYASCAIDTEVIYQAYQNCINLTYINFHSDRLRNIYFSCANTNGNNIYGDIYLNYYNPKNNSYYLVDAFYTFGGRGLRTPESKVLNFYLSTDKGSWFNQMINNHPQLFYGQAPVNWVYNSTMGCYRDENYNISMYVDTNTYDIDRINLLSGPNYYPTYASTWALPEVEAFAAYPGHAFNEQQLQDVVYEINSGGNIVGKNIVFDEGVMNNQTNFLLTAYLRTNPSIKDTKEYSLKMGAAYIDGHYKYNQEYVSYNGGLISARRAVECDSKNNGAYLRLFLEGVHGVKIYYKTDTTKTTNHYFKIKARTSSTSTALQEVVNTYGKSVTQFANYTYMMPDNVQTCYVNIVYNCISNWQNVYSNNALVYWEPIY